ncbi:MAG TPA: hypothetical protein VFU29_01145 [Chitinophagaceae bacterium]|nr:hypothetical protein [Chitinophagaceae bacterium]
MKQIILSILLYTPLINPLFAQQIKDDLIKEAEEKLKKTIRQLSPKFSQIKNMMLFILKLLLEK